MIQDDGSEDDIVASDVPTTTMYSQSAMAQECSDFTAHLVCVQQSPYMDTFYIHHPICVTIDSGAETNMIHASVARYVGAKITKSTQIALQADGQSPLVVVGDTRLALSRDNKMFTLEALVVDNLDVDVLAGVPFMESNGVAVRPAKHQVLLNDGTVYMYGMVSKSSRPHVIHRTQA